MKDEYNIFYDIKGDVSICDNDIFYSWANILYIIEQFYVEYSFIFLIILSNEYILAYIFSSKYSYSYTMVLLVLIDIN